MAYVWTRELLKIGALTLGHDENYKLKIDKEEWAKQQKEITKEVLEKVKSLNEEMNDSKSESKEDNIEESNEEIKRIYDLNIVDPDNHLKPSDDLGILAEDLPRTIDSSFEETKSKRKPNLSRKLYHEKKDRIRRVKETCKHSKQPK